jgi:hypothetical protein
VKIAHPGPPVGRLANLVPGALEHRPQQLSREPVVVYHQDARAHCLIRRSYRCPPGTIRSGPIILAWHRY